MISKFSNNGVLQGVVLVSWKPGSGLSSSLYLIWEGQIIAVFLRGSNCQVDKLSLEHIDKTNPTAIVAGFYALAQGGKQVLGRDNSMQ